MMKLASSCIPTEGVFKGRIENNMVGGEEKVGGSSNNGSSSKMSSSSSVNGIRPLSVSASLTATTATPKAKGGGKLTKMELDSGFSSRSPTPGGTPDSKSDSLNPNAQNIQNGGEVKGASSGAEGLAKRTGGEGRSKSSTPSGGEVKKGRTEGAEQNGDCKPGGGYESNSRSYYYDGSSSYNTSHSAGSGQYKKYYNQQYGYSGYGQNHYQHQRRYNNNNNTNGYRTNANRTSKNWSKAGSRSPSAGGGEWKEGEDRAANFDKNTSPDVSLGDREENLGSLIDSHNTVEIEGSKQEKTGEVAGNDNSTKSGPEVEKDSKKYQPGSNNSSNGLGRYKQNSNQQYGNGYAYARRYNNNNYNYRNYGNNRRQFQHNNDYYYHQNHHYNHQNGYYHRDHHNRGYTMQSPPFYNNYRRGNAQEMNSPDYDEGLPWPSKRGNWPNSYNANLSFGSTDRGYSSPRSRQCSPETSPTSTIDSTTSSTYLPNQGGEVSGIMINGNLINAQHLGPYDYLCGNMGNQPNGGSYPYPPYPPNFYYNYPPPGPDSRANHSANLGIPPPVAVVVDPNCSASVSDGGRGDKTLEWPDEFSDETDSESVATSLSTRCNSPEDDLESLPTLANDSSPRLYGETSPSSKESVSPNGSLCFRPVRRMSVSTQNFPPEWYEDFEPDDVVKQFHLAGEVKEKPKNLALGGPLDSLSEAIWAKFVANQQTTETFKKKVELWRDAYRVVRILNFTADFKQDPRNFPTFGLQVVGSTMSGFGSNTSDVDMCLLIRASEVDQRFEAVDKLQILCRTLKVLPCVENQELIYAKVPILKFRDANRRLEVDLNCNNFVGIRNTHLLYAYAQMDWRLKPLVLNVKLWAQFHRINDAKNMTISSYSLVLMVIHFLQFGVNEPVLPVLQKMYPEKFNNSNSILNVTIHETMPPWESRNKQSLAELLMQFFEYYGRKFDYTRNAISVRLGGTVAIKAAASYRSMKNDPHQWKYLCVEEPFDRTNTARSVYDHDIFQKIVGIFYVSWQRLLVSRSLDSIFTDILDDDIRAISMRIR